MPRARENNPTERICELLSCIEDLLYVNDMYYQAVETHVPVEVQQDLPPQPPLVAFHVEKLRQRGNYLKDGYEARMKRQTMERIRARGGSVRNVARQVDQAQDEYDTSVGLTREPKPERLSSADIEYRVAKAKDEMWQEEVALATGQKTIMPEKIAAGNNLKLPKDVF